MQPDLMNEHHLLDVLRVGVVRSACRSAATGASPPPPPTRVTGVVVQHPQDRVRRRPRRCSRPMPQAPVPLALRGWLTGLPTVVPGPPPTPPARESVPLQISRRGVSDEPVPSPARFAARAANTTSLMPGCSTPRCASSKRRSSSRFCAGTERCPNGRAADRADAGRHAGGGCGAGVISAWAAPARAR